MLDDIHNVVKEREMKEIKLLYNESDGERKERNKHLFKFLVEGRYYL